MNEMIKIDYNLNLVEYVNLSKDYTNEEKELLNRMGPLTYGGNITEPPLGQYYEDTGQYLGLVTDFMYALAIEMETDIVLKPMVWNDALEALKEGEIDLCDLTPSSERAEYYLFSDRIYNLDGIVLKASNNTELDSLGKLNGKMVGVQRGDFIIESLKLQGIEPMYIYTDNLTDALELLYSGMVDAVVGDEPVIKNQLNDGRFVNDYETLPEKIYESYVVLGIPKDNNALLPILDKAIFRLKKAGVLQKIQMKWLGSDGVSEAWRANEKMKRSVFVISALFIIVIYLVYAWNRNLKLLVDERTKDLSIMAEELEVILDNIRSIIILADQDGCIKKIKGDISQWHEISDENKVKNIDELLFIRKLEDTLMNGHGITLNRLEESISLDVRHINSIYECYITPIEGRSPLLMIIATNTTLERIQKAQIIHTNKMEAVGRLAAGIAHELRNPLGIVRNSTYILRDSYQAGDEEALAVDAIDRSIKRASKIIENLLNYSRLNDNGTTNVNISNVIGETVKFYKKSAQNKNVEFEVISDFDIQLCCDESAVRHVVTNLIGNAMDAIESEGRISIRLKLEDELVSIDISDTGEGIEEEDIEKIFDPFFTTKPVGKGTGLGLYIVYSQVSKLGGKIGVRSQIGIGSTFTVSFPATR